VCKQLSAKAILSLTRSIRLPFGEHAKGRRKKKRSTLASSCRETANKRDKQIEEKNDMEKEFSQLFWQKVFDMDFPPKVFELPLLRNAQKCHKN
jgi:hypothetical protein